MTRRHRDSAVRDANTFWAQKLWSTRQGRFRQVATEIPKAKSFFLWAQEEEG
jgi:hypothetical protein